MYTDSKDLNDGKVNGNTGYGNLKSNWNNKDITSAGIAAYLD